jgi:hypothetical protein
MGLSHVGFLVSKSFLVFCVFALLGSFGGRFYGIAQNTMFFKLSGADNRREAGVFSLLSFVATGAGMMLGGVVIAEFSFRTVFLVTVISNGIFMILSSFLPRTETVVIKLQEYWKTVFTPEVLFLTLIFFLSSLHWGAETVSYGPFLKEVLGLTIKQTGVYTGLGFIVVGLGAYGGTILLNRGWIKNLQSLFVVGLLLSGIFHWR